MPKISKTHRLKSIILFNVSPGKVKVLHNFHLTHRLTIEMENTIACEYCERKRHFYTEFRQEAANSDYTGDIIITPQTKKPSNSLFTM